MNAGKTRAYRWLILLCVLAGYGAVACLVSWLTAQSGTYPSTPESGLDALHYLHRGDFLYRSITREGNWYPILDMSWYNGVETWRFWPPLPAYVLALCQAVAGGSMFDGYLVFVGALYFLCAAAWLYIGCTHRRPWMGAAIGAVWFFIPNNLWMLYSQGALGHSMSMWALPLLFVAVYDWLLERRRGSLAAIIGSFFFVTLCHVGWAGMTAAAVLVFLGLFWLWNRGKYPGKLRYVVIALALGFALDGFLLIPSLVGATGSTAGATGPLVQSLGQTIAPLWGCEPGESWSLWQTHGGAYFGAAAFGLTLFGGVLSKREHRPGFWAALALCLMTATALSPAADLLGDGLPYLLSIALTLLLVCFLLWATLKKHWQRLVFLLLAVQCVPALCLVTGAWDARAPETRYDARAQQTLVSEGKALTRQRMSMVEIDGAPAVLYELTGYGEDAVWSSYGWEPGAAETGNSLMRINQAGQAGHFAYVFDRLLELGNDTVLIPCCALEPSVNDARAMDAAAQAVGYELAAQNEDYRLYHLDMPGRFGVVTRYRAIGIGTDAARVSQSFPAVEETEDPDLSHYTYDQLSAYDVVYLSGATGAGPSAAELVERLSGHGTRVVIAPSGDFEDLLGAEQHPNIVAVEPSASEAALSRALGLGREALPQRELVPLGLVYRDNVITIVSEYDGVNTTLSWHRDAFRADQSFRRAHGMVEVDRGITTIRLRYPALWLSVAAQAAGVALTAAFLIYMEKTRRAEARARRLAREESREEESDGAIQYR